MLSSAAFSTSRTKRYGSEAQGRFDNKNWLTAAFLVSRKESVQARCMDVSVMRVGLVSTAVSSLSGKKFVEVRCTYVSFIVNDLQYAQYFLLDIKKGALKSDIHGRLSDGN